MKLDHNKWPLVVILGVQMCFTTSELKHALLWIGCMGLGVSLEFVSR